MNKEIKIRVKTAVGMTEEVEVGDTVGQGTIEGALLSAVNIDCGVRDALKNSTKEISYGTEQ